MDHIVTNSLARAQMELRVMKKLIMSLFECSPSLIRKCMAIVIAMPLLVACEKEEASNALVDSSDYPRFFRNAVEKDFNNETIDCVQLVGHKNERVLNVFEPIMDVVDFELASDYRFKQCRQDIDSLRIERCSLIIGKSQEEFFHKGINVSGSTLSKTINGNGEITLIPNHKLLCNAEIERLTNGYNEHYKILSKNKPLLELTNQGKLVNLREFREITWAHGDVYAINIVTTNANYSLFFTDKSRFEQAKAEISEMAMKL